MKYEIFNPSIGKFHCGFEDEAICMFTQDKTEEFDWTRHSAATRDTKYTPNTGPSSDRSGAKQGNIILRYSCNTPTILR